VYYGFLLPVAISPVLGTVLNSQHAFTISVSWLIFLLPVGKEAQYLTISLDVVFPVSIFAPDAGPDRQSPCRKHFTDEAK
jgi:hypothetical protein